MEAPNATKAHEMFCQVAKDLGVSEDTIALIKKDLGMSNSEEVENEDSEDSAEKPAAKVVEVSVEKTSTDKVGDSPMMGMISKLLKSKC